LLWRWPAAARLKIRDDEIERPIPDGATTVAFDALLERRKTTMQTWFRNAGGNRSGAYFAYVKYLGSVA
jgi:hypothetical protein